ncbi:MAG: substrate-binding domain-containing protein [Alphaproteobacteria bacterium]
MTVSRGWLRSLCALVIAVSLLSAASLQARAAPKIAAASDLQFALMEVAEAFRDETGGDVQVTFGSSGNFYRQIRQGAPFDIFLGAIPDNAMMCYEGRHEKESIKWCDAGSSDGAFCCGHDGPMRGSAGWCQPEDSRLLFSSPA